MLGLVYVLMVGLNHPVYAVEYHFEEDFSGEPHSDWIFGNYVNQGPFSPAFWDVGTTPTFTFENELISAGEPNSRAENWAYLPDSTAVGAWSVNIFVPSNSIINEIWNIRFSVGMWHFKPASTPNEANADFYAAFEFVGLDQTLRFRAYNSTDTGVVLVSADSDNLKFDTYQHFDFIRTVDTFYVFANQTEIIKIDLASNIGPEIGYFTLGTVQGSGVKFDNVKITTDAQGKLDELNSPSTTTDPTSSETTTTTVVTTNGTIDTTSDNTAVFYGAGAGIAALTGSIAYWKLGKKKISKTD